MLLPSIRNIAAVASLLAAMLAAMTVADARPVTRDEGLRKMYGQLVIKGFAGQTPRDASVRQVRAALERSEIGGVILFHKNIRNPKQVAALTRYLSSANTPFTPLIAVDEEGGSVERLNRRKGFTYTPGHFRMQQRFRLDDARKRYDGMAAELSSAGFNTNFGPVVDLLVNPQNPIIARKYRSYGAHPLHVARYAHTFIEAHAARGIGTALKHWPGHGSSANDSHLRFVDVTKQWQPAEIEPYRRLFRAGYSGMVMTSHLYHKDWGMGQDLPASLSPVAIQTRLRDELGFDGVVITDDLQMRAITSKRPLEEAIVLALKAGNDLVLIGNMLASTPSNTDFAINAIEKAVKAGRLDFKQLYRSWQRVQAYKARLRR
ncbi:MAG: glycoside hydrolase family 3 N-terminal domain-containing protein [Anderseniella sp.]|jgi:beta-N-acetylhexosaminidase|nr:glycoside hydrolase family 3 N-terminal domain-containing protein [Anderseniella sp.]